MKVIDLLANQLNREATQFQIQGTEAIFTEHMEFWQLCFEARRLILEEKLAEKELEDETNKSR